MNTRNILGNTKWQFSLPEFSERCSSRDFEAKMFARVATDFVRSISLPKPKALRAQIEITLHEVDGLARTLDDRIDEGSDTTHSRIDADTRTAIHVKVEEIVEPLYNFVQDRWAFWREIHYAVSESILANTEGRSRVYSLTNSVEPISSTIAYACPILRLLSSDGMPAETFDAIFRNIAASIQILDDIVDAEDDLTNLIVTPITEKLQKSSFGVDPKLKLPLVSRMAETAILRHLDRSCEICCHWSPDRRVTDVFYVIKRDVRLAFRQLPTSYSDSTWRSAIRRLKDQVPPILCYGP